MQATVSDSQVDPADKCAGCATLPLTPPRKMRNPHAPGNETATQTAYESFAQSGLFRSSSTENETAIRIKSGGA